MFEVTDLVIAPALSEAKVDAVERQLRFRLPETLRRIYLAECASVSFDWFGRRGKLGELGCDEGDEPRGSLDLVSPIRLDAIRPRPLDAPEGIPGFVQFTMAPHGGGFCLFQAWENAAREIPIVWFDLDEPSEPTEAAYPTIEGFLDDWIKCGFVNQGNSPSIDYAYAFLAIT
ncbi:hypothetical protein BH09MYX1_BH09MYX1_22630 [soil metagenome]